MKYVIRSRLKMLAKAYLFFLSISWLGWGKTKWALLENVVIYILGLVFLNRNPLFLVVFRVWCNIYTVIWYYCI